MITTIKIVIKYVLNYICNNVSLRVIGKRMEKLIKSTAGGILTCYGKTDLNAAMRLNLEAIL
jgi:hypothetical protein